MRGRRNGTPWGGVYMYVVARGATHSENETSVRNSLGGIDSVQIGAGGLRYRLPASVRTHIHSREREELSVGYLFFRSSLLGRRYEWRARTFGYNREIPSSSESDCVNSPFIQIPFLPLFSEKENERERKRETCAGLLLLRCEFANFLKWGEFIFFFVSRAPRRLQVSRCLFGKVARLKRARGALQIQMSRSQVR